MGLSSRAMRSHLFLSLVALTALGSTGCSKSPVGTAAIDITVTFATGTVSTCVIVFAKDQATGTELPSAPVTSTTH